MSGNEYVSYREAAADISVLPYDPEQPDDNGGILIGTLMSDDMSCMTWRISPVPGGWTIVLDDAGTVDDDGQLVASDAPSSAYMLAAVAGDGDSAEPFESIDTAFDTFLDVVYATDEGETLHELRELSAELLHGYADPEHMPFDEFKTALDAVTDWNEHSKNTSFTRVANAMLSMRYPFLIPWRNEGKSTAWDDDGREPFDWTLIEEIPGGWLHRFGVELCEDIRNQCWHEDARAFEYRLCTTSIAQIKEKFGSLRCYWSTWGRGQHLLEAYETVSASICIKCGKSSGTRITRGYILPMCYDEVANERDRKASSLSQRAVDLVGSDTGWEERSLAMDYLALVDAIADTEPSAEPAQLEGMLSKWEWASFKNGTKELVDHAAGLLDGTPAPNGEPVHVVQLIREVAREQAGFEEAYGRGIVGGADMGSFCAGHELEMPAWRE